MNRPRRASERDSRAWRRARAFQSCGIDGVTAVRADARREARVHTLRVEAYEGLRVSNDGRIAARSELAYIAKIEGAAPVRARIDRMIRGERRRCPRERDGPPFHRLAHVFDPTRDRRRDTPIRHRGGAVAKRCELRQLCAGAVADLGRRDFRSRPRWERRARNDVGNHALLESSARNSSTSSRSATSFSRVERVSDDGGAETTASISEALS